MTLTPKNEAVLRVGTEQLKRYDEAFRELAEGDRAPVKTRIHPETGEVLRRRRRDEVVRFNGHSKTVSVEGWFPDGDGDGILTEEDVAPLDAALIELKAASQGKPD
jgi:hypothetical protein